MKNFNSQNLIERIEEAKDWLDKAKDEYNNENPVRGGLILNLAQAEVKSAWELSHRQFVLNSVQNPNRNHQLTKYFIPVAASFILFTGLIIGMKAGGVFPTSHKSVAIKIAKIKTEKIKSPNIVGLNKSPRSLVTVKSKETVASTPAGQLANQSDTKNVIVSEQTSESIRTTNSEPIQNNSDVTRNKTSYKPVSQLSFDEDALTKEASHSLRNGK